MSFLISAVKSYKTINILIYKIQKISSYFFMNNSTNIKESLVKVLNDLLLSYFFFSFHIVNKCRVQSTVKKNSVGPDIERGWVLSIPFGGPSHSKIWNWSRKKICIQGCRSGRVTIFLTKIKQNWIFSMEAKNLQFTKRFKGTL